MVADKKPHLGGLLKREASDLIPSSREVSPIEQDSGLDAQPPGVPSLESLGEAVYARKPGATLAKNQPLSGIKVLDFSSSVSGPIAGLALAEAGAEVVKVEKPGEGEPLRYMAPLWGHSNPTFSMFNRGKLSLALDLEDPKQVTWLEPLIRQSDILLEPFRPGVMAGFGLDYETVRRLNPRLIYCSITGYGQTGPRAEEAGHDLTYMAQMGLLSLSPGEQRSLALPPAFVSSFAGGAYPAVINILLALLQREKTGEGAFLDISITDNLFSMVSWAIAQGLGGEGWPEAGNELWTGGSPRYQLYPTEDGRILAVAALEDPFWEVFCTHINLPRELWDDRRDVKATYRAIRKLIRQGTAAHWRQVFEPLNCCVCLVKTVQEAMCDPHYHLRGVFEHTLENEYGDTLPAVPIPISPNFRANPSEHRSAPALGGHNDILLKKS